MSVSFSMMIDKAPSRAPEYNQVQSRTPESWIEDESVTSCFQCKQVFGFGVIAPRQKHHCRLCARIFCSACSSQSAIIPAFITKIPIPSKKHRGEDRTKPVRVCDVCAKRIASLQDVEHETKSWDLLDLRSRSHFQKNGNGLNVKEEDDEGNLASQLANFQLSTLREMQYFVPTHQFSKKEQEILWQNRKYFRGHSNWLVQLVLSIDYDLISQEALNELYDILAPPTVEVPKGSVLDKSKDRLSCWECMCGRTCSAKFNAECAIQILNQKVRSDQIRQFALSVLNDCDEEELTCHLTYLVRHSMHAPIVHKWLLAKCVRSESLANAYFWEMQCYLSPDPRRYNHIPLVSPSPTLDIMQESLTNWKRALPQEWRDHVLTSVQFLSHLRQTYFAPLRSAISSSQSHSIGASAMNVKSYNQPFYSPTNVEAGLFTLASCIVKDSITSPLALQLVSYDTTGYDNMEDSQKDKGEVKTPEKRSSIFLLWKPEDIRKDKVVLQIIQLAKRILLTDEHLDLPIVTYRVCPCSPNDGFIEMVQDCASLQSIRYTQQRDLLTWLIDRNEGTSVPAGVLRDRFVQSCASYCVLTYLLGIGDRHLDNIMLRTDGALFHIDYGFILGQDPKPLKKPRMRITYEMSQAMGGVDSEAYARFKKLCTQIYNCLRRHINLFVCLLRLLVEAIPPVDGGTFDERRLMEEVLRRFVPGESDQEAEVQLYNQIEHSTTSTITYALIDYFHLKRPSSSMSAIPGALAKGAVNTAHTVVTALWSVAGLDANPLLEKVESKTDTILDK